jgi:hypothetical protein
MSGIRKPLLLDFCDFWPGFSKTNNVFYQTLRQRFDIEITDQPDVMIYADPHSHVHRLHDCIKVYFGIESYPPDWRECDYALTCHYLDDERHLRLPYYVLCCEPRQLSKEGENIDELFAAKTRFCGFVVSNAGNRSSQKRVQFFHRLSEYKRVDSAGRTLNNIGGPLPEGWRGKLDFLKTCKFNIAFENKSLPGYTTEKLVQAMLARCIPIYWGNPRVGEEFNPASFLNYSGFPTEEALIERIIELDRDDAAYKEMLRQPYFNSGVPNEFFSKDRLCDFFERILKTGARPRRNRSFFFGRWMLVKRNKDR